MAAPVTRRRGRLLRALAARVLPVLAALWVVLPLLWAAAGSLKPSVQRWASPLALPDPATLENYRSAIAGGVLRYWLNSALVTLVCVAGILLLGSLAAYAFARLRFAGRDALRTLLLSGMMVPVHAVLIPLYLLSARLHIHGTPFALLGPYLAFGLPLSVVLLTAYFAAIPTEVEDAARLDGCSDLAIWWRVALPMSRPGLATAAIVQGVWVWNEFPIALVLCSKDPWRTLPVGLSFFQGQYQSDAGGILAGVVLASLPLLVIFFLCQRLVIRGMTAGALKG